MTTDEAQAEQRTDRRRDLSPVVHIVDDDAMLRESMALVLEDAGFRTRAHASVRAFFECGDHDNIGCIVTDLRMPEASGIDLLAKLRRDDQMTGAKLPVVVVSAHGEITLAVHAMKKGAADYIQKPFSAERLVCAVREAMALSAHRRDDETPDCLPMLSQREREVASRVVAGKSNRAIGEELGISERTVESHRAAIMRKTGARNLPDLMRMATRQNGCGPQKIERQAT